MATEIWGCSDDLIEFRGDVEGEVGCYGTDEDDSDGVLLMCSDGTVLVVKYGKNDAGIWGITLRHKGTAFDRVDQCDDEDAKRYSDTAHFGDGLKWVYACKENWERVH